jgi:hypothetical protein
MGLATYVLYRVWQHANRESKEKNYGTYRDIEDVYLLIPIFL